MKPAVSAHFARACAQVVQLRRELAASQDYERLSARATELRKSLAETPIVATSDPLPAAFSATLGRVLPLSGTEGVALLLTMVIELMSCCGVAGLKTLYDTRDQRRHSGTSPQGSLGGPEHQAVEAEGASPATAQQSLPRPQAQTLPKPSLRAVASRVPKPRDRRRNEAANPPSNVLRMRPRHSTMNLPERATPPRQGGFPNALVLAFVDERLQKARGASLGARELRAAYEAWCAAHGYAPLSVPKLAAALKAMGFDKWKRSGLIRYRDLQLAA